MCSATDLANLAKAWTHQGRTQLTEICLCPLMTLRLMTRLPHATQEYQEVCSEGHKVNKDPLVHLDQTDHEELVTQLDGKAMMGLEDHQDHQDLLECRVWLTRPLGPWCWSRGQTDPFSRKNYEWQTSQPSMELQPHSTNGWKPVIDSFSMDTTLGYLTT